MTHGCVELWLVVRGQVPRRVPTIQAMGNLDTFTEQVAVQHYWPLRHSITNLVFKFKGAVGGNDGAGPEGSRTGKLKEGLCE